MFTENLLIIVYMNCIQIDMIGQIDAYTRTHTNAFVTVNLVLALHSETKLTLMLLFKLKTHTFIYLYTESNYYFKTYYRLNTTVTSNFGISIR